MQVPYLRSGVRFTLFSHLINVLWTKSPAMSFSFNLLSPNKSSLCRYSPSRTTSQLRPRVLREDTGTALQASPLRIHSPWTPQIWAPYIKQRGSTQQSNGPTRDQGSSHQLYALPHDQVNHMLASASYQRRIRPKNLEARQKNILLRRNQTANELQPRNQSSRLVCVILFFFWSRAKSLSVRYSPRAGF